MTDVDIWIEVFKLLNMKFIDEECHGETNLLKYSWGDCTVTLSFFRKSEVVLRLGILGTLTGELFDIVPPLTRKKEFENEYKDLFRDAKLNLMLK